MSALKDTLSRMNWVFGYGDIIRILPGKVKIKKQYGIVYRKYTLLENNRVRYAGHTRKIKGG